ncbi:MAG: sugar transferase [Gemmatimonadales bacterium]|nr:MAG: sugar transferase [Gemmatimonadales bacterium]
MTIITHEQVLGTRRRPSAPGWLRTDARSYHDGFKRWMDLVLTVGLGLASLPLLLLGMLLVRLTSSGPVFFRQTRVGRDGRTFEIVKLRTMVQDAERGTGAVWACEGDPRITPVGRFLRRTRIDELPQFWNVLRGDMSLVGPRPERPEFHEELGRQLPGFHRRIAVRPGLTGRAQVEFQYCGTVEEMRVKLRHDLQYIREMGLSTDLSLLLRTVFVVLRAAGR